MGHSADGWEEVLLPEMERQQQNGKEVTFRADAAYAKPDIYEALEGHGMKYALHLPANECLERDVAELSSRPVERPSVKPLGGSKSFLYQVASWMTAGETRTLLLAAIGRRVAESKAVRQHAENDRSAASSGRLAR